MAAPSATRALMERQLDSLERALAIHTPADLRAARLRFKESEGWLEFYFPSAAATLNARRPEVDDDDAPNPILGASGGFWIVESSLSNPARRDSLDRALDAMRGALSTVRANLPHLVITEPQALEIVRQEIARVATLGIAGYDAPTADRMTTESAAALDGVESFLGAALSQQLPEARETVRAIHRAADFLRQSHDRFDRLDFIVSYEHPATQSLRRLNARLALNSVLIPRFWRASSMSVYDPDAFDPRALAPSSAPTTTPALVRLGERLFSARELSGDGTRSCASCHVPSYAFTDGVARQRAIGRTTALVARNTPTLINAALQPFQFADQRATTLEDQIPLVLASPSEMGSSIEAAAARLATKPSYVRDFSAVFQRSSGPPSQWEIRAALAAYARSLVRLDAPFDRAVRGDLQALTAEQHRGFDLFMGKARCGTCHFPPLFSGVVPPAFVSSDVEVIGAPSGADGSVVDSDSGRTRIDHDPAHLRAFKTPSLRNAALTAPYMHNGALRTLRDVIDFYDRGGPRRPLVNQTLPSDSLHLNEAEKRALIAFIEALTSSPP